MKSQFEDLACEVGITVGAAATAVLAQVQQAVGNQEKGETEADKKPVSQNQLQNQVEKGQAPKEVDRVDKPHVDGQQPHVHFKDGTSLNQDGTIHDAHRGMPNI